MPDEFSAEADPRSIDDVLDENLKYQQQLSRQTGNAGVNNYPSYMTALPDARKYGTSAAAEGYVDNNAVIASEDLDNIPAMVNRGGKPFTRTTPVTDDVAEQIAQAEVASHRSGVARLGFDPARIAVSPKSNGGLTIGGMYRSKDDQIWYDMNSPSTAIHESLHRGLEQLRQAGIYPKDIPNEELLVRALMSRFYGDVEVGRGEISDRQIKAARERVPAKQLDDIEAIAADQYARRRPGGPR